MKIPLRTPIWLMLMALAGAVTVAQSRIGREVAIPRHLQDGDELQLSLRQLIQFGEGLFVANWTSQEGAGRPATTGTGAPLADPSRPLVFPRNFNRVSAPDANSCAGCHNAPFGVPGGGGDVVANVFVLAQRRDFVTFGPADPGDERGLQPTLETVGNSRATLGMFGSGFIEMLARQISIDLQRIRDAVPPGASSQLSSKGINFGFIARRPDGTWDVSRVEGLPAPSLASKGASDPPNLIVRPFHQAGNVISLRQFSVNAFNHHHGIQPVERFGSGTDPDDDGFADELTETDVTAVSLFQATMAVPGRVIPRDRRIEAAIAIGERNFAAIGCASCHISALPLDDGGWIFTEPGPFNPPGTLSAADRRPMSVDLTDRRLPQPRLPRVRGRVWVPAFTDLKLHDITDGDDDPNIEPLDMNQPIGSPAFFAGNRKFLTRKLWGVANEAPFFHHGKFTTLREAVLAHGGEAAQVRARFNALREYDRDAIIEFLKSLQVLPPGTSALVVDENGRPRFDLAQTD